MNELVKYNSIAPHELEVIMRMGPIFHASKLFGGKMVTSPEVSMSIMLMGHSLGINPIASLNGIYIIENRPSLAPKLMLGLVYGCGLLKEISFDPKYAPNGGIESYSITATRLNPSGEDITHTESWSIKQAKEAGLTGKHNWKAYPESMLKWRVVGWICDVLFSDVVGGMKSSEELGAIIDESGSVIESTFEEVEDQFDSNAAFQSLLVEFGVEMVFANSDMTNPPQTEEEIDQLEAVLIEKKKEQEEENADPS